MRTGRPLQRLSLSDSQRQSLERWVRQHSIKQARALRARIVLLCAQEQSNQQVAQALGIHHHTVGKWRARFVQDGLDGLLDAPRSGAPRTLTDERVARVVQTTLQSAPKDATHWSPRSLGRSLGESKSSIARFWRAFGLQPHRCETFKLSTDPDFVDKVHDIVGLYMDPPERALVLCVDEKSQIQALDRTSSVRRSVGTARWSFWRSSTPSSRTCRRSWTCTLSWINYCTHKTHKVRRWLAKRPCFHVHFTPTSSSWLNLVERFFALLTQKPLRRGVHRSVAELEAAVLGYIAQHNESPKPFIRTKTADQILESIERFCLRTLGMEH